MLLREGTDSSQGKGQILSNIAAWYATPLPPGAVSALTRGLRSMAVVDIVQSTLGPRGMDKLIYDDNGACAADRLTKCPLQLIVPADRCRENDYLERWRNHYEHAGYW